MLRRLAHPALVGLRGALARPASRGPCRLVGGALVPTSLDVYLALDLCPGGDLFSLRGPLPAAEARSLTRQAAAGLAFLHAAGVWHRDIKSSNLFLAPAPPGSGGRWTVKIGDFGSARSCWDGSGEEGAGGAGAGPRPPALTRAGSLGGDGPEGGAAAAAAAAAAPLPPPFSSWTARSSDLAAQARPGTGPGLAASAGGGWRPPLTRCVATPLYRAPEVAMSRGGYTAAIDAWSLGCVFGELLQRVPRPGAAPPPPSLRVAPLFAVKGFGAGLPLTPASEGGTPREGGDAGSAPPPAATELDALFDVVGTPSAADIAAVPSPAWRAHLGRLPHRAPSLFRRLGNAGEVAVSLLASLLAFDPARRATPAEALSHEYFTGPDAVAEGGGVAWPAEVAAAAGGRVGGGVAGGMSPSSSTSSLSEDAAATAAASPTKRGRARSVSPLARTAARAAAKVAAARPPPPGEGLAAGATPLYYQEADPARALALLEDAMTAAGAGAGTTSADAGGAGQLDGARRGAAGLDTLRALLEAECAAAEAARAGRRGGGGGGGVAAPPPTLYTPGPFPWRGSGAGKGGGGGWAGPASASLSPPDLPPQVDAPPSALAAGRARVPCTADAAAGALDASDFLAPGRHGEWVGGGGGAPPATPACGAWGVSEFPPGVDVSDPAVAAAVRRQQAR